MQPKIHIIVPFISLNNYVLECIEHTLKLDYDNFSLILLPDFEIDLPSRFKDKRIKVLVTGNKLIGKKRNLGMEKFSYCDYFAFIDSDAYPRNDWLKESMKFSRNHDIGAIGGPNITPPNEPLKQRVVGNASKSILISGTYRFRKRIAKTRYCNNLPTCNLLVTKQLITKLKGFNENLITGEDIDLCQRIIKNGKKILYARKVVVYHHNRTLWKPFVKQRLTWGLSVFKVMKENPTVSNLFLFLPLFFILFMSGLIVLSFFHYLFLTLFFVLGGVYLLSTIIETIRWSGKVIDLPLTFTTLFLGNIMPGFGSIWAILRVGKKESSTRELVRKIYRNF